MSNSVTQLIFQLESAAVSIVPNHLQHPEEKYTFAWALIGEKHNDDPPARAFAFGTNLTYSAINKTVTPDNTLQAIEMTAWVKVEENYVPVKVTYSLYQNATKVNSTAGQLRLWGGSFHYSLTIGDWPFLAHSNRLDVTFSLASATSNSTSFGHDMGNENLMFVNVVGPDDDSFVARVPKKALLSPYNSSRKMDLEDIGINVMLSLQSKFSIGVSLLFPKFQNLYYDGVVSVDSSIPFVPFRKASNAGLVLIIFLSIAGGFLLLFGLITAFFHWRREESSRQIRYL